LREQHRNEFIEILEQKVLLLLDQGVGDPAVERCVLLRVLARLLPPCLAFGEALEDTVDALARRLEYAVRIVAAVLAKDRQSLVPGSDDGDAGFGGSVVDELKP